MTTTGSNESTVRPENPGLVLVLGGARSGKSAWAERLVAAQGGRPIYLATAEAGDAEMAARIERHQARRGPGWTTVEEPLALEEVLAARAGADTAILVDCLTLWTGNLMHAGLDVGAESERLVARLADLPGFACLVSNEVGQGIVPENAMARAFRDHAGRLHQAVAAIAGRVVFVTAGLATDLKGAPAAP